MIGSLGFPELMFILVLALLIFGPRRLPEIGRTLGRALGEFRRSTNELKRSIETEISVDDNKPSAAVRQGRQGPSAAAATVPRETPAEPAAGSPPDDGDAATADAAPDASPDAAPDASPDDEPAADAPEADGARQ